MNYEDFAKSIVGDLEKDECVKQANQIIENCKKLQELFGGKISIDHFLTKDRIPRAVCTFFSGSFPHHLSCERLKVFDVDSDDEFRERVDKAKFLRTESKCYSGNFIDHQFRLKLSNKIVAEGFSPYIDPKLLNSAELTADLKTMVSEMCDAMFDGWRDIYNISVTRPGNSIHNPGLTVTVLFIRK